MADSIRLTVSSPEGGLFEKDVSYVNLPTENGSIGILKNHAPLLCAVAEGRLRYRFGRGENGEIIVGPGFASVSDDRVLLLVAEIGRGGEEAMAPAEFSDEAQR